VKQTSSAAGAVDGATRGAAGAVTASTLSRGLRGAGVLGPDRLGAHA